MRKLCLSLIGLFTLGYVAAQSPQAYFKTEYIGSGSLLDDNGNRVDGNKGAALVYKGGVNLPFSTKISKDNPTTIWGVALSVSYTSFNNNDISKDLILPEMVGTQVALYHIRTFHF